MKGIELISTGRAIPGRCVTNDDLAKIVDTNDAWIKERTGIASRYFCTEDENGVSLSTQAASQALERAGIRPDQVGACIVATVSPDNMTPSTANMVADALGLPEDIPAFDLSAACSGFLYSLRVAQGLLSNPDRPYAVIVGCEVLSRLMDFSDRNTCVLFGDGAGAAVIHVADDAEFCSVLGNRADLEAIRVAGPTTHASGITMDGRRVFRFAVKAIPTAIDGVLAQTNLTMDDMDYVVCHQANSRIIDHVVKRLKADPDKFYKNMDHYANTSAASIPIALDEMYTKGLITHGSQLLCVGFGAGLTWGGCTIRLK